MNNWIENKSILVIGGTGTIGNALVRTLLTYNPKVIRIFSRDEHKQFEMKNRLHNDPRIRFLIGDVRDKDRLVRAMEGIHIVFHLAAMKHVQSCEYNPFEAVQTNIIGTQNVIQAANINQVEKVIFTSSDKAISPTNTYGATKLTAERLISAAEYQKGTSKTCYTAVRFGNVLGSRGSVVPLFKEQILEQKLVTLTDGNVTRFMMTKEQAVHLLLEAGFKSKGGEVFVLKMPTLRMYDLTRALIKIVTEKYKISAKIEIKEIGLRPGEKKYEELMTLDEAKYAIELPNMYIIPSQFLDKKNDYGGVRAKPSTYSSEHEIPLTEEEIMELLKNTEGLI
jgi:UDP-N-acetylglucosamine 4,6-dehydratase/5-epimerase